MWIFLGIVAFVALLITVILLLPVYVILKTDENGDLILRYKFLHKVYGENPDPNNPILRTLKESSGISRLEKERLRSSVQTTSLVDTVSDSVDLVVDILKRLLGLLKYCTIRVFKLKIVCAEGDAAQTAISCGKCYAVVSPLMGLLSSAMKLREKGTAVTIEGDYLTTQAVFALDIVLSVRVFRVLSALLRAIIAEAKRMAEQDVAAQQVTHKNPTQDA